jgi:hypothetical protein
VRQFSPFAYLPVSRSTTVWNLVKGIFKRMIAVLIVRAIVAAVAIAALFLAAKIFLP